MTEAAAAEANGVNATRPMAVGEVERTGVMVLAAPEADAAAAAAAAAAPRPKPKPIPIPMPMPMPIGPRTAFTPDSANVANAGLS